MAILSRAIPEAQSVRFRLSLAAVVLAMLVCCQIALAQMNVLHSFSGSPGDGYNPATPVTMGPNGAIYGTAAYGGNDNLCPAGCGDVFQMTPPAEPGADWTYSEIYEFHGPFDGSDGASGLTLDPHGRLYGVTYGAFPEKIFRLTPSTKEGTFWHFADSYDLRNSIYPSTPLIMDNAGALYGVSLAGGPPNCGGFSCGLVVQYIPLKQGRFKQKILYQFTGGADGAFPASLVLDNPTGVLYGVAEAGGINSPNCTSGGGCGTAFRLTPRPEGTWNFETLYRFTGAQDKNPYSVVKDSKGNLYGLAFRGQQGGEVFKLTRHANGLWTDSLLHRFAGQDTPSDYCGYMPSYLTLGSNGVLYGAIFGDIDLYFGALFQLVPPEGGHGSWTYTTLWDFNESGPDLNPTGVVLGPDGALYGATNGGDSSGGTVFQLQLPSQAPWPPNDFCY